MNEEEFKEFDSYFKPNTVALIGVSKKNDFFWLQNFVLAGYPGKVFPINPKGPRSSYGVPFYKSILDITETIDYAVISVPAPRVPQVLKECIEKKVKLVTIFTSGFSETGKNECTLLEKKLSSILKNQKNNPPLRVIGPNCMGIYCPENKVSFRQDLSLRSGTIGFIAQSGGLAQNLAYKLKDLGIGISKIISYGNQIDLTCTDFLEYLTYDKKTKIICAYIEGVRKKDRPRFFNTLREASLKKPVILWKGGVTEAGSKAAFTHTGALSGSLDIWNAAVKQAGIIKVNNFDEFINNIIAFKHYKPQNLKFKNINKDVVLLSISGGSSVTNTDDVVKVGLNVPKFSPEIIEKIENNMIYTIGVNSSNPLDLAYDFFNFSGLQKIFDVILDLPISSVIFEISLQY
ncbi:MAG: CoA-binding protein, partial [Promethearchaeota archaeon]